MSRQTAYHQSMRDYLDGIIDMYSLKCQQDIKTLPYPEVILGYASIEIEYNDTDMECLQSLDIRDMMCANLKIQSMDTVEDLNDTINEVLCEHFKDDFNFWLLERIDVKEQEERAELGQVLRRDSDNGEYRWHMRDGGLAHA